MLLSGSTGCIVVSNVNLWVFTMKWLWRHHFRLHPRFVCDRCDHIAALPSKIYRRIWPLLLSAPPPRQRAGPTIAVSMLKPTKDCLSLTWTTAPVSGSLGLLVSSSGQWMVLSTQWSFSGPLPVQTDALSSFSFLTSHFFSNVLHWHQFQLISHITLPFWHSSPQQRERSKPKIYWNQYLNNVYIFCSSMFGCKSFRWNSYLSSHCNLLKIAGPGTWL